MGAIEGLFANLPPIVVGDTDSFGHAFTTDLSLAENAVVCTGYVAAESIVELQARLEIFENVKSFDLIVGMARFDGLTSEQHRCLKRLDDYLNSSGRGRVYISMALPIHTKLARFTGEIQSAIIGSSNLGSLTRATRQYEVDVRISHEPDLFQKFDQFLEKALQASKPFSESIDKVKIKEDAPHPLENMAEVTKTDVSGVDVELSNISFEIPVKVEPKSSMNVYFGKGRVSVNGRTLPRPWYEVELIVSKSITQMPGYPTNPGAGEKFTVKTDDGYQFECKTSGDFSKNFRSAGDLETLGRWLKGRLELAGALELGQPVTEETLKRYGRDTITMTKALEENYWYLDFGAKID